MARCSSPRSPHRLSASGDSECCVADSRDEFDSSSEGSSMSSQSYVLPVGQPLMYDQKVRFGSALNLEDGQVLAMAPCAAGGGSSQQQQPHPHAAYHYQRSVTPLSRSLGASSLSRLDSPLRSVAGEGSVSQQPRPQFPVMAAPRARTPADASTPLLATPPHADKNRDAESTPGCVICGCRIW